MDKSAKQFIQPTRIKYSPTDLQEEDTQRYDFRLKNVFGTPLQCSIYYPDKPTKICVLYLHSFNGCRLEGAAYAKQMIQQDWALCCFDFQGAGLSGGEYVTFGAKEKYDVLAIYEHLAQNFNEIYLWGRSMGATVALLYILQFGVGMIQAIVLDSPFKCLNKMATLMLHARLGIPKIIAKAMVGLIKSQVEQVAQFQFTDVTLPKSIPFECPMLMIGSSGDQIIPFKQLLKVYTAYIGPKQLHRITQGHNERRDNQTIVKIIKLFQSLSPQTRLSPSKTPISPGGDNDSLRLAEGLKIKHKIMCHRSTSQHNTTNSAKLHKHKGLMQMQ